MSLKIVQDVRIPADSADFETTESRSALPPVEFRIISDAAANNFIITDRQYPAQRAPTVAYRVYFLMADIGSTGMSQTSARQAAQRMGYLVGEVQAPGRGTVVSMTDTQFFGLPGWYYCVGVNRLGIEAPCEHSVYLP